MLTQCARLVAKRGPASARAFGVLAPTDTFVARHLGPSEAEIAEMLKVVGVNSLDGLVDTTVPKYIRLEKELILEPARSETEALAHLDQMIGQNELKKSFIGMGYYEVCSRMSEGCLLCADGTLSNHVFLTIFKIS